MIFDLQSNGKSNKYHIIRNDAEEFRVFCGSKGEFLIAYYTDVDITEESIITEEDTLRMLEHELCKSCLKSCRNFIKRFDKNETSLK